MKKRFPCVFFIVKHLNFKKTFLLFRLVNSESKPMDPVWANTLLGYFFLKKCFPVNTIS